MKIGIQGFPGMKMKNPQPYFQNSKWWIQYGGSKVRFTVGNTILMEKNADNNFQKTSNSKKLMSSKFWKIYKPRIFKIQDRLLRHVKSYKFYWRFLSNPKKHSVTDYYWISNACMLD